MAPPNTVGMVIDGSLGRLLSSKLSQCGFHVQVCEITGMPEKDHHQLPSGLFKCSSPKEAAQGATTLCFVVSDFELFETVFDDALSAVAGGTLIILCGSYLPTYLVQLEKKLSEKQNGLMIADLYASIDTNSEIKVLASGKQESLQKMRPVLSAMCKDFVQLEGDLGAASKVRMVDTILLGVHIAAAAEAVALGASAGLDTWDLYEIIINAAGNSCAFEVRVPQMLADDLLGSEKRTIDDLTKNMNAILEETRTILFPLPLTSIAHQYFHMGSSCGDGALSDAALIKVWERLSGIKVIGSAAKKQPGSFAKKAEEIFKTAAQVERVGFIGLGAMGFGMATTLLQEKFTVCGFDVYEPTMSRFKKSGGLIGNSVAETSKGAQVVIVMVATEAQAESVLFGEEGAVRAVSDGCTFILCSTVSPVYVENLEKRIQAENRDLQLIDAPVSGGVKRAANGTLTIMAAGSTEAFRRAGLVLSALSETLYVIEGGAGKGSSVKVVNQLLAGVHIAAAGEAMALGARLGLHTRSLYQNIISRDGSSWMFVNRVPHMLDADYTPYSAVNIFVKDLGIVLGQGKSCGVFLHLAATAHQQFLLAAAAGYTFQDDSAVVKIYEKLAAISVACKDDNDSAKSESSSMSPTAKTLEAQVIHKSEMLENLGPEWPNDPVDEISKLEDSKQAKVLVVLDDDPTGTQTVHGITVLTEWTIDFIKEEFLKQSSCFFILTNSRALSSEKASALIQSIARNVKEAAALTDRLFTIVLRGDSTLRGHFPEEVDAVTSVIGETDAWILCPFFPQGGRYTIGDIHYVADEDKLVPAGETEFAKDAVFGYRSSNLKEWVEEKTKGRIKATNVASISIETLRKGGPQAVCEDLCKLTKGSVCIVNAATERDISVFSAGMLQAELKGKKFLCRTAATFVSARIGIRYKPPMASKDLGVSKVKNGGLIVVGSYVPKTTKQVEELKAQCSHLIHCLEVHVPLLASGSPASREEEINHIASAADALLAAGKDTLIMTSRTLITGKDDLENLDINSKVSSALVEIVKRIQVRPRYLLAKGGITSSDLATKAMKASRAEVVGQALAGVPIWKLGDGSRHPGTPYIVFPGNVGSSSAIAEIVKSWACEPHQTAKDILLGAAKGQYAVGAFNVYNLEAISAVVAAAEAESSSAILQIHPSALKHGKEPLVASCIAAAKHAKVPVAVHLDHGNDERDIMTALEMGFDSIMIDCSHLPFQENLECTRRITKAAHSRNIIVEAELGRLSGTEDGLTVEEYEEKLTDPVQADKFLKETEVDALAVCIGNVHGKYPASGPKLKLDLLQELSHVTSKYGAFLVLHGASGLPSDIVKECIRHGVRKFNVNTEVRSAYVASLKDPKKKDLLDIMSSAEDAMKAVVAEKLRLFESAGKAAS